MDQPTHQPLLQAVAAGKPASRVPVWIMRQAGRYLPEYREFTKNHSFFENCGDPERAKTITLQPITRFDVQSDEKSGLDAAIIFSDILVIPVALGFPCEIVKGTGPVFSKALTINNLFKKSLSIKDCESISINKALRLTRQKLSLQKTLIGFTGGPWTLFAYMVEGKPSKTWSQAKKFLYQNPKEAKILMKLLSESIVSLLQCQINSGAQVVQVFESNTGFLTSDLFDEFVLPYITEICRDIKKANPLIPVTIFCRGAHWAIEQIVKQTEYDTISLDWTMDPEKTRECVLNAWSQLPSAKKKMRPVPPTLQGNLDPCCLYASSDVIIRKTHEMMDKFHVKDNIKTFGTPLLICNLGHGIYPDMPVEGANAFIQAVHSYFDLETREKQ